MAQAKIHNFLHEPHRWMRKRRAKPYSDPQIRPTPTHATILVCGLPAPCFLDRRTSPILARLPTPRRTPRHARRHLQWLGLPCHPSRRRRGSRPRPKPVRPYRGPGRLGPGLEAGFDHMDQNSGTLSRGVRMAKWLRYFLRKPFEARCRDPVHSRPGNAPWARHFLRRIVQTTSPP